ncbi:MAG: hypothetical protein HYU36_03345 [Planctomycetes bacterium]|nr:hypothetical protein [Planctomycetota bacterium]
MSSALAVRALVLACLAWLAVIFSAEGQAGPGRLVGQGEVEYQGRKFTIQSAVAIWRPKTASLWIMLHPVSFTPEEEAKILKDKSTQDVLEAKPSPDPKLWSWVPSIWITANFKPGSKVYSPAALESATLAFLKFENASSSSTLSGSGFKFHQDFQSLTVTEMKEGGKVTCSVRSQDPATHHYKLQGKVETLIISEVNF